MSTQVAYEIAYCTKKQSGWHSFFLAFIWIIREKAITTNKYYLNNTSRESRSRFSILYYIMVLGNNYIWFCLIVPCLNTIYCPTFCLSVSFSPSNYLVCQSNRQDEVVKRASEKESYIDGMEPLLRIRKYLF